MMDLATLRSYRVLDISLFDLTLSFAVAGGLAPVLVKKGVFSSTTSVLASVIPLGVLAHLATGTETTLNKKLLDFSKLNWAHVLVFVLTYGPLLPWSSGKRFVLGRGRLS